VTIELSLKIVGAALWLALAALMALEVESPSWIVLLLLFSPLVLMPISRRLIETPVQARKRERSTLAAAVLLGLSFCWLPAPSTAVLAVPWLIIRLLAASDAWLDWRKNASFEPTHLCLLAARVFPAIGAAWLLVHRANWTPLGFDPLIVLLTGAHFHHAGFTLPLIASLQARRIADGRSRFACLLILIGVPMVAVGITSTHFGFLAWVEPVGVCLLVLGSLIVAWLQLCLAMQKNQALAPRLLLAASGLALLVAMSLALGFGLRYLFPSLALSMPHMWAYHGSLNVFGFGLCGLLGWRILEHRQSR